MNAYRSEVDGLRALAVLAVMLFHADVGIAPGGFVGVDVFFVISGYLITGLLSHDLARNALSFSNFYARRARRLLPALALVVIATGVGALLWMPHDHRADHFRLMTAVALFHSNFVLGATTGYFDAPAEDRPLLHTWSLGVEEQFYFVFPFLLLVLWRRGRTQVFLWITLLLLASLLVSEIGWRHHRQPNFFFTPSRLWELLLGSLAALWSSKQRPPTGGLKLHRDGALAAIGLGAIIGSMALLDRNTPSPSVAILVPTFGTALVLIGGRSGTLVARLFSMRPLVAVGLISYSAYLWHQPVLAFARMQSLEPLAPMVRWGLIAGTLALAGVTWKFVEQPFRHANPMSDRKTLVSAVLVTAVLVGLGLAGQLLAQTQRGGVPESVTRSMAAPPRSNQCFDIPQAHSRPAEWMCPVNPGAQRRPSFIVLGDSHALQVLETFELAAQQVQRSGIFAGFSGCAPLLAVYPLTRPDQATQDCHALNQRVLAFAKAQKVQDIYLVAKWSYYTDFWNGTSYLNAIGFRRGDIISLDNSRKAFRHGVMSTVQAYRALGIHVHVLEQAPQQLYPPVAVYERAWAQPASVEQSLRALSVTRAQHRQQQSQPRSVFDEARAQGHMSLMSLDDLLCQDDVCVIGRADSSYYQDQSHLSDAGAKRLLPALSVSLSARR